MYKFLVNINSNILYSCVNFRLTINYNHFVFFKLKHAYNKFPKGFLFKLTNCTNIISFVKKKNIHIINSLKDFFLN